MAIFHCYVSSPEGTFKVFVLFTVKQLSETAYRNPQDWNTHRIHRKRPRETVLQQAIFKGLS